MNKRSRLCRRAIVAAFAITSVAHATIDISTVTVGNAGNLADTLAMNDGTSGYGSVNYAYRVGKYEVTAGQYTAFLNAVAATDSFGLYNSAMASDVAGCQIIRSGSAGSYTYSVASDYANRPVNYVSWGDAARFSNWLANGQPTGTQSAATTETGSYSLNGATTASSLLSVTRSAGATWVITSENEWYKAAYYNPITASYSQYATGSDTLPSNDLLAIDPGNNANYLASSTDSTIGSPYFRTEVGTFGNSDSFYGTFDQNGNVWEWNESTYLDLFREMRGGSIGSFDVTLAASFRYFDEANFESNAVGFRVASTVVAAVPGDFNGDGSADSVDIDLLFGATQGTIPPASSTFDLTGDGVVNATPDSADSDADYWVRIVKATEYGDADLDQRVDFDDLLVVASHYNASAGTWAEGNFDGVDGVSFNDLLLLAKHYNFSATAAHEASLDATFAADWALAQSLVPEPGFLSALLFGGAAMRRRRTPRADRWPKERQLVESLESRRLLSAALPKIYVIYNGTNNATVINPYSSQGVAISATGGAVTVTNTSGIGGIEFDLLGTSSAGSLTVSSNSPATFVMSNLNLANASGAAIAVTGGQAHTFISKAGTTNTLADGSASAKNGTLQSDGKITFSGSGVLNLTGVKKHAIVTTSSIDVQSSSIHVASAASDGLHSEGFAMSGGTVTVAASLGDGIDAGDGAVTVSSGTINITSTAADVKAVKTGLNTMTFTGGALNLNVSGSASKAISAKGAIGISAGTFGITLSGAALLTASGSGFETAYSTGIKSDGTINISGGTFIITATSAATGARGISADGAISVTGGTIQVSVAGNGANYTNASGVADSFSAAAFASDAAITITGGSVTTTSSGTGGKGLKSDGTITIGNASGGPTLNVTTTGSRFLTTGTDYNHPKTMVAGGAISILNGTNTLASTDDGIHSDVSITISGGTNRITATSATASVGEGVEAPLINFTGGTTNITATNDGINATKGLVNGGDNANDGSQLNISGGIIVVAGSDAIDSNGNITVTGGTTIICGPTNAPEEGIDYNGTFNMNGGLVVSAGSNSQMTKGMATTSTQTSLFLKSSVALAATSLLHIQNASGTEMVTFKPRNNVYWFHFSSGSMAQGTQYRVYFGGTYTGGSYVGGSSGWGMLTGGTYAVGTASLRSTFTTSTTSKVNTITMSSAAATSESLDGSTTQRRVRATALATIVI